jgi:hypothetical protein
LKDRNKSDRIDARKLAELSPFTSLKLTSRSDNGKPISLPFGRQIAGIAQEPNKEL